MYIIATFSAKVAQNSRTQTGRDTNTRQNIQQPKELPAVGLSRNILDWPDLTFGVYVVVVSCLFRPCLMPETNI